MTSSGSFYTYSALIFIGPIGCLTYFLLQLSSQYGKNDRYGITDKLQRVLIFSTYIVGFFCGIIGYTLHLTKHGGEWCKIYGMIICFGSLGLGKAIMYAIFLYRAKIARGDTANKYIFNIFGPFYIVIYWLCYVIGAALFFHGVEVIPDDQHNSYCVFEDEHKQTWFLIIASIWDLLNCIIALYLFLIPLNALIQHMRASMDNIAEKEKQLLNLCKWAAFLSFIATISSFLVLLFAIKYHDTIWALCLFDPFVNSGCTYFMLQRNRSYCIYLCHICNKQNNENNLPTRTSIALQTVKSTSA